MILPVSLLFSQHYPNFTARHTRFDFFCRFPMMYVRDSEKFLLKPLKITIFRPNFCKNGVPMGHAQNKKLFQKLQNQILSFQTLFVLTKYHMFWLSYECFSILCKAFLLKITISSHNRCVILVRIG